MKGTFSTTCAGVRSSHPSSPHESADEMRRFNSSIRSVVRATSTPPLHVDRPSSSYCRALSFVSVVISLEWSTGKMKFDAWPVEPPGFGNGPLSSWTRSVQPSSASQPTRLLPTMPPPITTALAPAGKSLKAGSSHGQEHAVHRLLEVLDMGAHRVGGAFAVSVPDRFEERAVRLHRLLELVGPIQC